MNVRLEQGYFKTSALVIISMCRCLKVEDTLKCVHHGKRGAKPKMHVKKCVMREAWCQEGWLDGGGLQKQPKANLSLVKSNTATLPPNKKNSGRTTERNLWQWEQKE